MIPSNFRNHEISLRTSFCFTSSILIHTWCEWRISEKAKSKQRTALIHPKTHKSSTLLKREQSGEAKYSSREGRHEKSHFSNWKWRQGSRWKKWKLVTICERSHSMTKRVETKPYKGGIYNVKTRGLLFLMLLNMRSSHSKSFTWQRDMFKNGTVLTDVKRTLSTSQFMEHIPSITLFQHIKILPSFCDRLLTSFISSSAHKRLFESISETDFNIISRMCIISIINRAWETTILRLSSKTFFFSN